VEVVALILPVVVLVDIEPVPDLVVEVDQPKV
jgi:hypothetical protein